MTSGSGDNRSRVGENRLTEGLAELYRRGYAAVLVLMLAALLSPVTGWEAVDDLALIGIVVLLALPLVSAFWVGLAALRRRDTALLAIVIGIFGLLVAATILPFLLSGGS